MKRRYFLSLCAAAPAGAAYCRFVEPAWFDVSFTRVSLNGVRPRRILHISDIHMSDGMTAEELDKGLSAGLAHRPDMICITGDFVSRTTGFDRPGLDRLLRKAADAAPSYAVLGNHDGGRWLERRGGSRSTVMLRDLIAASGVRVLHNDSFRDGDITLIGLGDYWSAEFHPGVAFAQAPAATATIVLSHNPDSKSDIAGLPWHLMLSGHTHGGQCRIPGVNPIWTPVADKRFVAGLYQWKDRQLFISRGIGSPKHVRAFCRPEVSILEIG
jgi:predicted MPP superfamily phosphohydrolase